MTSPSPSTLGQNQGRVLDVSRQRSETSSLFVTPYPEDMHIIDLTGYDTDAEEGVDPDTKMEDATEDSGGDGGAEGGETHDYLGKRSHSNSDGDDQNGGAAKRPRLC